MRSLNLAPLRALLRDDADSKKQPGSPLAYLTRKAPGAAGLERAASLSAAGADADGWCIKAAPAPINVGAAEGRTSSCVHSPPASPLAYLTRKGPGAAGLERATSLPTGDGADPELWMIKAGGALSDTTAEDRSLTRIFSLARGCSWEPPSSLLLPGVDEPVLAPSSATAIAISASSSAAGTNKPAAAEMPVAAAPTVLRRLSSLSSKAGAAATHCLSSPWTL
ncbi:N-acetylglucosamine transferase [Micractinium conductrix]|uniref:N-acetylglucosamine transferase n=1 Tax=Micractinium conductrix TaxID=554055 RepID=A0A2P6V4N0_9CHLO|nr:N-acetylglucosamine transferase [Micractinium conductrix]|eukprot:PSC69038.1 N-acetylglucosamine transferase [Micractinium conductrix]